MSSYPADIYDIEQSRETELLWDNFTSYEPVSYTCITCDREVEGDDEVCETCQHEIDELVERLMNR